MWERPIGPICCKQRSRRQERVALENARTLYAAAWKQLGAYVSDSKLLAGGLRGSLDEGTALPDSEASLTHVLEASRELQIAQVEITRSEIGLKREKVEPTPNILVRVESGHNFESKTQTTTVNVGVRLPLFDKNQGNIQVAESQLHWAMLEAQRVELSLRQRFPSAEGDVAWTTGSASGQPDVLPGPVLHSSNERRNP